MSTSPVSASWTMAGMRPSAVHFRAETTLGTSSGKATSSLQRVLDEGRGPLGGVGVARGPGLVTGVDEERAGVLRVPIVEQGLGGVERERGIRGCLFEERLIRPPGRLGIAT